MGCGVSHRGGERKLLGMLNCYGADVVARNNIRGGRGLRRQIVLRFAAAAKIQQRWCTDEDKTNYKIPALHAYRPIRRDLHSYAFQQFMRAHPSQ